MFSATTRELSSVREILFGVTPAAPTMAEVRALKEYSLSVEPGKIDNNEIHADRMSRASRPGNKKGDFSIPFQLSYGDFDEMFEEVMGGSWTPLASTTGAITVAAAGKTLTRAAGSFLTDGFAVGQQIITTNFVTGANNGTFLISDVSALVITCATAVGLVDEVGPAGVNIKTAIDVLKVGNVSRSRTFEDRNPDANLYEVYNGCVMNSFDIDISPEKIITGSFKGIARDCVIAAAVNQSIAVASGGKTFTMAAGGFLKKGSAFAVGMNIITSGFTNAGNNGTFLISAVTDTVITCATAAGLVTEANAAGRTIVMGSLGEPTAAGTEEPYDSYTGDLGEGDVDQTEATGVKISFDNGMQANYVILTAGADAAASIRPNSTIKLTGELSAFFENQALKQKFLSGTASTVNVLLGTGLPGGKSMRFKMDHIKYTGNNRSNDATIVESAPFDGHYAAATGTQLEIHRIP
jgi:hypothetical protein